jgi:hypothetical protein
VDAEDLYRLTPEDFTAARDAAAKQARADGDREAAAALKALRRPTVSAWLLNTLVRQESDLVEQLLELGPVLAQAQAGGDAAALRTVGEQRRQLVGAVVGRAVALAGRPVTAALRDEVAATLEAALADPASAEAVRSGRLVRALSYAGFGDVDLSDAVAPPSPSPATSAATSATTPARKKDEQRLAAAEAAALDAAGRLDDAVRACRDAEQTHDAAVRAEQERAAVVDRLTQELADARAQHDVAATQASAAAKAARKAAAKVERAQDRAERARDELDRLRRGD